MAVPKKKVSKSRRNKRRSHDALPRINVIVDSETGEYRLPHRMSLVDGFYKKRQVIAFDASEGFKDETEAETL